MPVVAQRDALPFENDVSIGPKRIYEGEEFSAMLVLSRKVGERIHVGENIVLEIRRIAGNRVTLALDAPRNVRILRGELETAAREFRTPAAPPAETEAPPASRVTVRDHIPVHTLAHDCATIGTH